MYIVEMNDKNISDAAECYCRSWKSSHSKYFPEEYVDSITAESVAITFRKEESQERISFVAFDKGNVVGFVTIDKDKCEMPYIYVVPEKQRQGIGKKLMEFGIKQMTGINRVYTTILSVNEIGINFCEENGFDFTGEQRTLKNGMLELKYVYKKKK